MKESRVSPHPGRRREDCNPEVCGVERRIEGVMERFTLVSEKLTENQTNMRISIQKLTDNAEFVNKLDQKVDRVEAKVDRNSQLVWKIVGAGMMVAFLVPLALQYLGGIK